MKSKIFISLIADALVWALTLLSLTTLAGSVFPVWFGVIGLVALIFSLGSTIFFMTASDRYGKEIKEKEDIIHASEEKAEQWRREYYECRKRLWDLVELKDITAWERARKFLEKYKHNEQ